MINNMQIKAICQTLSDEKAQKIASIINKVAISYKLTNDMLQEFIANLAHESGEFSIKAENLNYSTASRLVAVWPSRFNLFGTGGRLNANNYVHNAKLLANTVYNGRMGNIKGTNDGYDLRGGGFCQLTGREAYTLYTAYINRTRGAKYTINEIANLVMTDDEWAMDVSAWFFCEYKNLEQMATDDKFKEIVQRWNGGFIGMADRNKYYQRALKVIH